MAILAGGGGVPNFYFRVSVNGEEAGTFWFVCQDRLEVASPILLSPARDPDRLPFSFSKGNPEGCLTFSCEKQKPRSKIFFAGGTPEASPLLLSPASVPLTGLFSL